MKTLTFYSYKGGTGRSLLLAYTARHLARLGKRVAALDLDLEAPGLHYKLNTTPAGKVTAEAPERGAVDYLLSVTQGQSPPPDLLDYVLEVPLPLGTRGSLRLIPAGAAPTGDYWKALTTLLQQDLFTNPEGSGLAAFLELKTRIEEELQADFLLIDSRTGITELAGVSTTVLADTVVCLMLANRESQTGARAVLRSLRHAVRLPGQSPIEIFPVLSRVPEHDEAMSEEVLSFLNEPAAPTPEDTLALAKLYVLRIDPALACGETLHLGSGESRPRSPLHQDYLDLLADLVGVDPRQVAEELRSMPSLPTLSSLRPPRDWQVFEDLCWDLMRRVWNDPHTQKHGRSGQRQKGVDIFGQPNQENDWVGMQCKLTSGRLSPRDIEKDITQAREFKPHLKRLIVATTSPRDSKLQEYIRTLDETERRAGSFSVTILFWDDIASLLRDYPDVAQKYYPEDFLRYERVTNGRRPAADATRRSGLEVVLTPDRDLDYVGLLPGFSSPERETPDATMLMAGLSNIQIINHDSQPIEIFRLWLDIDGHPGPPPKVQEEVLTGSPKIEARSRRRFDLSFAAEFEGAPRQEWRQRVVLRVKPIGFGELQINLADFFH